MLFTSQRAKLTEFKNIYIFAYRSTREQFDKLRWFYPFVTMIRKEIGNSQLTHSPSVSKLTNNKSKPESTARAELT